MKSIRRWQTAWAVILGFAGPAAQAAPPPAEIFFRDADIVEAVLSPSGRRLAVTSARGIDRIGLVVLDLSPGGAFKRVMEFSDADVRQVRWVNEERLVFGAVDLSAGSGRPSSTPGLFAINADGSRFRRLLNGGIPPLHVPRADDGETNHEILVMLTAGDSTQLPFRIDTRTGKHYELHVKAPANTVGWITDSRGEPRVALTRTKDRQAAHWRAPGSSEWKQLYESGLLSTPFAVEGVDDAGNLYVTRSVGDEAYRWLARHDAPTGKTADKFLLRTPGFDFYGSMIHEPGGDSILGVRVVVDGATTVWFDDRLKALQAQADKLFPGRVNRIDCRRCTAPDMVALLRSSSDHDPGRLYLYQAQPPEGEKPWRAIGPVREGLKAEQMASMDLHRIQARDGRDLPVWVTRPDGAKGPLPAVVLVHGGPWVRGRAWGWHPEPQFLASRGYLVIEPEMRGSTGYGDAHFHAGFKQWGRAMQDDVADALRWAQQKGLASDKACIAGNSYGGYSTLMGLANDADLFRCGVAGFAITDLDLYLQGSFWVRDDISDEARKYSLPELVGDPERDAREIAARSPINVASRIKAPVMLVFGEDDRRVPLAHGERMRRALREAGNEPVWVTYAGEGHGLGNLKNRIDFAERMEAFLAKYLQP